MLMAGNNLDCDITLALLCDHRPCTRREWPRSASARPGQTPDLGFVSPDRATAGSRVLSSWIPDPDAIVALRRDGGIVALSRCDVLAGPTVPFAGTTPRHENRGAWGSST